jgi:drug/metabolite transporter (DMT)-like permease
MSKLNSAERSGFIFALLTAIFFSLYPTVVPISIREGLGPLTFVVLAMAVATFLILVRVVFQNKSLFHRDENVVSIFPIAVIFIFEHLCIPLSLRSLDVAVALPFMYIYPLLIAGYVALIRREQVSPLTFIALVISLFGLTMVVNFSWSLATSSGVLFALLQGTLAAARILLTARIIGQVDPTRLTAQMFVIGTFFGLLSLFFLGWQPPRTELGWLCVLIAGVSGAVGHTCLAYALSKVSAVRVGLILNIEPVIAAILAVFVLNQVLTIQQYIGAALVLTTIAAYRSFSRTAS